MADHEKKDRFDILRLIAFFLVFSTVFLMFAYLGKRVERYFASEERAVISNSEGLTVIIDAGHGGEDGGAVGIDGSLEKDINLSIALTLRDILSCCGVDAVLTRDTDILLYDKNSDYMGHKKEQDLNARRLIAESYENAVFISIHMNSFTDSKYNGLQVYYSPNNSLSASLAENIQETTAELLINYNRRKIKKADGSIYLLNKLSCPAVLIECGFLSNAEDCERFASTEYRKKLSLCIASAITDFLFD